MHLLNQFSFKGHQNTGTTKRNLYDLQWSNFKKIKQIIYRLIFKAIGYRLDFEIFTSVWQLSSTISFWYLFIYCKLKKNLQEKILSSLHYVGVSNLNIQRKGHSCNNMFLQVHFIFCFWLPNNSQDIIPVVENFFFFITFYCRSITKQNILQ